MTTADVGRASPVPFHVRKLAETVDSRASSPRLNNKDNQKLFNLAPKRPVCFGEHNMQSSRSDMDLSLVGPRHSTLPNTTSSVTIADSPQLVQVIKCKAGPEPPKTMLETNSKCEFRAKGHQASNSVSWASPSEFANISRDLKHPTADNLMIVDCRPFTAFNRQHITGAYNISCNDAINKKRLQQGKICLSDLITPDHGKTLFKSSAVDTIFLYDDSSSSESLSSTLDIVANRVRNAGKIAVILQGGLTKFQETQDNGLLRSVERLSTADVTDGSRQDSGYCSSNCGIFQSSPLAGSRQPHCLTPGQIENAVMTKVLPYLYVGNEKDAKDCKALRINRITHILNVSTQIPNYFDPDDQHCQFKTRLFQYRRIPAVDCAQQNLRQFFDDAFQFIESARNSNGCVLVHCLGGISRSATIAIAYLMRCSAMSLNEAYQYVKQQRSIVSPNMNFIGQLYEFEQDMQAGRVQRVVQPPLPLLLPPGHVAGEQTGGGQHGDKLDSDRDSLTPHPNLVAPRRTCVDGTFSSPI